MNKRIAIFGSSKFETIEYHIADSLRFLGNEVEIFDYDAAFSIHKKADYWMRRFSERISVKLCTKIAEKVLAYRPDLIIATYRDIHPVFVETIKATTKSIPCIHINPDAITTFQNQQIFASGYDHYFTKDPFMVSFMKDKMKLNAHLLNESFNQRVHTKPALSKQDAEREVGIDVLAFGSMYPYRTKMLEAIVQSGISISMYGVKGPFFPKSLAPYFNNKKILGEEKSKLLYGSKIVFNNFHYAEIEGVNCKFFEVNGIGAFQISDFKSIMNEYMNIDAKRVSFDTIDEAVEKIKYFLNEENIEERIDLAEKNYTHFMENHTYDHRVKELFTILNL